MVQDKIVNELAGYFQISPNLLNVESHIVGEKVFDLQDKLESCVVQEKQGNVT